MRSLKTIIALLSVSACVIAQTYLTGELSGTFPKAEYNITGNIHILPGKTLQFAPGSRLLFENYTGIIVRGTLLAQGTHEAPIFFTSFKDVVQKKKTKVVPAPFDWNGITVAEGMATVQLGHAYVRYSTFGIDIKSDSSHVVLDSVLFSNNGYRNLARNDRFIETADSALASYTWQLHATPSSTTAVTAEPASKALSLKPDVSRGRSPAKTDSWKFPVRISCGVLAAGGLAFGIFETMDAASNFDKYNTVPTAEKEGYKDKSIVAFNLQWVGYGLAFVALSGLTLTFVF